MIQTNICSSCGGIFSSPYGKGYCIQCGCTKGVMADVSKNMKMGEIRFFEMIEAKLSSKFFKVILNFNSSGVMFRFTNVTTIHGRLGWVKEGITMQTIELEYPDVLLGILEKKPIPWVSAYEILNEYYTGRFRRERKEIGWARKRRGCRI